MAAITNKGSCHVWEMKVNDGGKTVIRSTKKIPAHKRYGLKCVFSPDSSRLATSSADSTSKLWKTSDFKLEKVNMQFNALFLSKSFL